MSGTGNPTMESDPTKEEPPLEDDRPGLDLDDDPTKPEAVAPDVIAPDLESPGSMPTGIGPM